MKFFYCSILCKLLIYNILTNIYVDVVTEFQNDKIAIHACVVTPCLVTSPLISKIGLDRATYIQKMKPEVACGGHIGVTTCQVAPIARHMLRWLDTVK